MWHNEAAELTDAISIQPGNNAVDDDHPCVLLQKKSTVNLLFAMSGLLMDTWTLKQHMTSQQHINTKPVTGCHKHNPRSLLVQLLQAPMARLLAEETTSSGHAHRPHFARICSSRLDERLRYDRRKRVARCVQQRKSVTSM